MIVQCPNCLKRYRMKDSASTLLRIRCRSCAYEFLVSPSRSRSHELSFDPDRPKAVVADIQRDIRHLVVEVLRRQRFHLFVVEDGDTAYRVVKEEEPRLLFVNPYLPKIMGVDLISRLREEEAAPQTIFLLGAIHNPKRYRRRPESLYGADDYIEEGFREAAFLEKLRFHMDISLKAGPEIAPADMQAYRLGRAVLADLLVYETDRMRQVKRVSDFFRLFKEEAAEGKTYIENRAPGKGNMLRAVVADYLKRR